jgi:hypothetical protein
MKPIFKLLTLLVFLVLYTGCSEDSTSPSGNSTSSQSSGGSTTGSGGSLARFTIASDHLYIVSENQLFTYSLSDASTPAYKGAIPLWGGVETIYAMDDHLFFGTQNGVLIYNISNADAPQYVSNYVHVTSCDPVVARGDYAYSTLRTGQQCWRGNNQLDVINISSLRNPYNEISIDLENPMGLGLYEDFLYVCDNDKIKQFDVSRANFPVFRNETSLSGCFDVIIKDNTLIAVHTSGVSQYRISSEGTLSLLSTIN